MIITSEIRHTHRTREQVEAWAYVGQPFEEWPDWLRSHYENRPGVQPKSARIGHWALRDDEGYFWKWLHPEIFERRYVALTAGHGEKS